MQTIKEKAWRTYKAFETGGFLHINATSSGVDSIRLIDDEQEGIPYITRTDSNNGVIRFVGDRNYEFGFDEAGCITVGLDTQTAFYQPHKFITGQNIHIVTGDAMSPDLAHFLVVVLRKQMQAKFNWGGNGATLGRMKRLVIMLPASESGLPDYEYMTKYISNRRREMLSNYRKFAEQQIASLEYNDVVPLKAKTWRVFNFNDVFEICKGFYNKKPQCTSYGTIPFIGATDSNNGITSYLSQDDIANNSKTGKLPNEPINRKIFQGGAICVTNNGSVGHAYFEPKKFTCSHDVNPLYLKDRKLTKPLAMFLIDTIEKQGKLFMYARKWRPCRMVRSKIMLPIANTNQPDYEYMEQYAKNMMLRKYQQYLAFLEKRETKARE